MAHAICSKKKTKIFGNEIKGDKIMHLNEWGNAQRRIHHTNNISIIDGVKHWKALQEADMTDK